MLSCFGLELSKEVVYYSIDLIQLSAVYYGGYFLFSFLVQVLRKSLPFALSHTPIKCKYISGENSVKQKALLTC